MSNLTNYVYGVEDIDTDPLCVCFSRLMENPRHRNILKLEENSIYCMCLGENAIWSAVPDIDAISQLLTIHLPVIYKKALSDYASITDTSNPSNPMVKVCLETLICTIRFFMEGDELVTASVFDRIRRLLYHVTKRFNPGPTIILHTTVQA